jgi:hypothetical protein
MRMRGVDQAFWQMSHLGFERACHAFCMSTPLGAGIELGDDYRRFPRFLWGVGRSDCMKVTLAWVFSSEP